MTTVKCTNIGTPCENSQRNRAVAVKLRLFWGM